MYKKKKIFFIKMIMPFFMIIAIIDASYNAYVSLNAYFPGKTEDKSILIDSFKSFVDETKAIVDHINKEDKGFFRIEKLYRRSNNDAMLIGYNGLSHFSSCETEQAMRFLGSLGFRDNGNWAFYGEGSTTFADCFMGVKYLLSQYDETPKPYERIYDHNDKYVFKNPYALPLCFTMDQECFNLSKADYDHFTYQNAISKSMGYKGKDIYTKVENVKETLHNLTKIENSYKIINNDEEAYIEFSFVNKKDEFIFMYFNAEELQDTKIVVNDLEKQPYFTTYGWSIRELGHYPINEKVILRIYAEQDEITLNGYEFYYEDKTAIAKWYEEAVCDKCELNKITSSRLMGTADIKDDKVLVFSFPYEEEWKVYIDGKRMPVKKAVDGLLSVNISKGKHDIELKYMPKGIIYGLPFMIISLIILIIIAANKGKKSSFDI